MQIHQTYFMHELLQSSCMTVLLVRRVHFVRPPICGNQSATQEPADERFKSSEASEKLAKKCPYAFVNGKSPVRLWPTFKVTAKKFNGNFKGKKTGYKCASRSPTSMWFFLLMP